MPTLAELKAERERRSMLAPVDTAQNSFQREIRTRFNEGSQGEVETHLDGVPLSELNQGARLRELKAEKLRREAGNKGASSPLQVVSPTQTGNPDIDFAGTTQQVPVLGRGGPTMPPIGTRDQTFEDIDPASEEGRIRSAARDGVDFRVGLPFIQRVKLAGALNTESAQAERMSMVSDFLADLPEGAEAFRFDPDLGQMLWNRQITQEDVDAGFEDAKDIGKLRWTAINEEGFTPSDMADLFDLPELGSLIGGVVGAGKGKALGFFKRSGAAALGGFGGREAGNLAELGIHMSMGGEAPSFEEASELFASDAGKEAAAAIIGETVSKFVIDPAISFAQRKMASALGKEVSELTPAEIARANANARSGAEATEDINKVVGGDFEPSRGEISGDLQLLELERSRIKNGSPAVRQAEELRQLTNRRGLDQFVRERLGGDPTAIGRKGGIMRSAKEAVFEGSQIGLAQTSDNAIRIFPMGAADEGLTMYQRGGDVWQITDASLPPNLKGIGLGTELYEAAVIEARATGHRLVSDTSMTADAVRVWNGLDGKVEVGDLKWNVDPRKADNWLEDENGVMRLMSDNGGPIVETVPARNLLDDVVDSAARVDRADSGKMQKGVDFERFLFNAGRTELGTVAKEATENQFKRGELLEPIYENYQKWATPNGKFSIQAHRQWLADSERVLEKVLKPEELHALRVPGNFDKFMKSERSRLMQAQEVIPRILKAGDEFKLTDNQAIINQLRKVEPRDRRRALDILRQTAPGQHKELRNLFAQEIVDDLRSRVAGSITKKGELNFSKWVTKNERLLGDIMGPRYLQDIKILNRAMQSEAQRTGIRGTAEEATPGALALFRAVWGPLSRKQRGITAARRIQVRNMGTHAIEVISNPQQLRELIKIHQLPMTSAVVGQTYARLGTFDAAGLDEDDPQAMQRLAEMANGFVQESLSEQDSQ